MPLSPVWRMALGVVHLGITCGGFQSPAATRRTHAGMPWIPCKECRVPLFHPHRMLRATMKSRIIQTLLPAQRVIDGADIADSSGRAFGSEAPAEGPLPFPVRS